MNKKGFTLVELMAVIAILGIILLIAVPSYLGVSKKIKEDMWDNKLKMIETAVEMWVQDNKSDLCEYDKPSNKWKANADLREALSDHGEDEIALSVLISNGYLKGDDNDTFINPIDNEDYSTVVLCETNFLNSNNNKFYFCNNTNIDKLCK